MTTFSGTQVAPSPRNSAPNQGRSSHSVPGPLPGAGQAQGTLQMGGKDEQPLVKQLGVYQVFGHRHTSALPKPHEYTRWIGEEAAARIPMGEALV